MCYQLVRDISVVLPGHPLTDGGLHQTGQRGQHIDGWVDLKDRYRTVWIKQFLHNHYSQFIYFAVRLIS